MALLWWAYSVVTANVHQAHVLHQPSGGQQRRRIHRAMVSSWENIEALYMCAIHRHRHDHVTSQHSGSCNATCTASSFMRCAAQVHKPDDDAVEHGIDQNGKQ